MFVCVCAATLRKIRKEHPWLYEGVITGRAARRMIAHKRELLCEAYENGYINSKLYAMAEVALERSGESLSATQSIVKKVSFSLV